MIYGNGNLTTALIETGMGLLAALLLLVWFVVWVRGRFKQWQADRRDVWDRRKENINGYKHLRWVWRSRFGSAYKSDVLGQWESAPPVQAPPTYSGIMDYYGDPFEDRPGDHRTSVTHGRGGPTEIIEIVPIKQSPLFDDPLSDPFHEKGVPHG